ncbi:alpha/beta fold hydrolase [Labrys okinawensis]|uniref:alpha/beta fold hydrolase n=1 Tax=Labrys okinawensis TaxID=346911 RepID=UPI0039BC9B6C
MREERLPHKLGEVAGITRVLRSGKGDPVVLIHGVGLDASIWAPQFEALGERFDIIAYDMLGHGRSSPPPIEPQLSDYAEQTRQLLDSLGIEKAHVVGHSMGALIAIEFALNHPGRCRSITALNAVYCRSPAERSGVEQRAATLEIVGTQTSNAAAIERWFGSPVPPGLAAKAETVSNLLCTVDPAGYARTYRLFATSDRAHEGRLGALQMPSLFMTGELDANSSPAMSRRMAAEAPRARAEVLPNERHMMAFVNPEAVNGILQTFLALPTTDPAAFRRALGAFPTGVTIVSTVQPDGTPRGFTANSFSSVSLDPPLILVCIARTASSYPIFSGTRHFAVSVLAEHQKDVSRLFASKTSDKFKGSRWRCETTGSPVIEEAAAWFDCRTHNVVDAGDHIILIGEVAAFGGSETNPLGYCRGAYVDFALSQKALAATAGQVSVGAILESDKAVLLLDRGGGRCDLPEGHSLEPRADPASLRGVLAKLGLAVELGFLFAVFEEPGAANFQRIYYRGSLLALPEIAGQARLFAFDEIPWNGLRDDAVRSMLRRFVREREENEFGVYIGNAEEGTVHRVDESGRPFSARSPA